MTIGFNCPHCGSPSTRARRSDNVRPNCRRKEAGHGILNYCCDCKLAWWMRLDPLDMIANSNNMTDDDDDDDDDDNYDGENGPSHLVEDRVESAGFVASSSAARADRSNVVCANCEKPIATHDASFLCSQNCGRSFHIDCVRDPLVETLACRTCIESASSKPNGDLRSALDLGSLRSVRDALNGFVGNGTDNLQIPVKDFLWPDSCETRIDSGEPNRDPSDALTQEIQTAWQQCVDQLPEDQRSQSSTILDSMTSTNLKNISSDLLDKMLQKMMETRTGLSPTPQSNSSRKCGPRTSWHQVIHAARSLNVDSSIIYLAEKSFLDAVSKEPCPEGNIEQWLVDDVAQFLRWCQLPQLESAFRQNQVDGKCLASLTWEDLKDDLEVESDLEIHLLLDQVNLIKTNRA